MPINTESPISFTASARTEIAKLQHELNIKDDQFLRIGIKGGGCAGVSYLLAFDKKEEKDDLYLVDGIQVIVNKAHTMHILGLEIDYEDDDLNKGFVFINPSEIEK